MKKFLKRVISPTPKFYKIIGRICTAIGLTCGYMWYEGLYENNTQLALIIFGAFLFGGTSVYSGQKVKKDGTD